MIEIEDVVIRHLWGGNLTQSHVALLRFFLIAFSDNRAPKVNSEIVGFTHRMTGIPAHQLLCGWNAYYTKLVGDDIVQPDLPKMAFSD